MKIGVDLRFLGEDLYSDFIKKLLITYIINKNENNYIIYTNKNLKIDFDNNVEIKKVDIELGSFKEQFLFNKILKKDNNDTVIFFGNNKPIFYKNDNIIFVDNLKDIYYTNFKNSFEKYKYISLSEKNYKNASTIITLDQNTKDELIERFNIREDKVKIISGFFPKKIKEISIDKIEIDIKTKFSIKNDYFIYSAGEGIEKNYEKLVTLIHKLDKTVDLIFIGDEISKNVNLRNLVLEKNLQNNIKFLSVISSEDKILLFKNSLGIIFPSFYEPFPFELNDAVYLNTNIITSNLDNIKNIFGEYVTYFSPISINSIYNETVNFLKSKNESNYKKILEKYNLENSARQLIEIIK